MTAATNKVLVLGYGNPGRLDDGLGPAFVERLEAMALPGVMLDADYQLTVEDAVELANCDVVVFVDADVKGAEPFYCRAVESGDDTISFSTHHVTPEAVVGLATEMFGAAPEAYVIGIRGYAFDEFGQRLSAKAQANLDAAVKFFESALARGFADCASVGAS